MALTKRQKTLIGIFCVALVVVVAERVLVGPRGGPDAASADSLEEVVEAVLSEEDQPEAESPSVAERLRDLAAGEEPNLAQLRNPFSLPASWFPRAVQGSAAVEDAAARFVRTHQLTAVVMDGPRSGALIDNRFLVPGQVLDGFRLVSVADRSAVFEGQGRRVTLELLTR